VAYLVELTVPPEGTSCAAQTESVGFGGLRDEIIDELVRSGLSQTDAECIINGVIDKVGAAEFNRMVLEQDTTALVRIVQAQTLGCAGAGG
jgi:hypothetical protein